MGAFLLACGTGKRYITKNAEVMIHQPLGGIQGQATDMEIATKKILKTKKKLDLILAEKTGQNIKTIEKDTDRDYWLSAEEAKAYGLVDKILDNPLF
jgi:ATP-dependent Clp protease protease subunit